MVIICWASSADPGSIVLLMFNSFLFRNIERMMTNFGIINYVIVKCIASNFVVALDMLDIVLFTKSGGYFYKYLSA